MTGYKGFSDAGLHGLSEFDIATNYMQATKVRLFAKFKHYILHEAFQIVNEERHCR